MKLRSVIAILAGGLFWFFAFPVLVGLMATVWPSLGEAVQVYRTTGRFNVFDSTSMLIAFQVLWLLANGAAGLLTALISKRRTEVLVLMGVLVAWFAYNHFWAEWDQFPAWYNVLVVVLVAPMVLIGGRIPDLVKDRRKPAESATAS